MMSSQILIIGNIYDKHICRLVTHVKNIHPHIIIDIFNTMESDDPYPDAYINYRNVYSKRRNFPSFLYYLPGVKILLSRVIDPLITFKSFVKSQYDLVNIHYVTLESYFLMRQFKKVTNLIMVSPWGSDIYRIKKITFKMVKNILDQANYVSVPEINFRKDIKNLFQVSDNKFIDLGFGSDAIDSILSDESISIDDAKKGLNISGKYVITCGYNGSRLQNHKKIIEAISNVSKHINEDLLLVLPMTYGGENDYLLELEALLVAKNLKYIIFNKYLTERELFFLRKCSDMFIHAQPSDAFSGSVQEYLLTETKVINGIWTRYPDLEKYGIPYYVFNSFTELENVIFKAYNDGEYHITPELKKFIEHTGWNFKGKQWARFYDSLASE